MKLSYYNILFVLSLSFGPNAHAQIDFSIEAGDFLSINYITSSSFEMLLYPTPGKLDPSTTDKVTNLIKNLFLVSASNSSPFSSIDTIDVLVEGVKFEDKHELEEVPMTNVARNFTSPFDVSFLQFKIALGSVQDKILNQPTRFTLDKFIVRIFSQPSTKSNFVDRITKTMDPFLADVQDIHIDLTGENMEEEEEVIERADSLSRIDIVLVIASSFIFAGIVCIFTTHWYKDGYEDIWEGDSFTGKTTNSVIVSENLVHNPEKIGSNSSDEAYERKTPLTKIMHVNGNIIEAGSLESSIDSQSHILQSIERGSPEISFDSSSSYSTSSSSASHSTSTSSSKEYLDTSIETSAFAISKKNETLESIERELNYDYNLLTKTSNSLSFKVLSLPGSDNFTKRKRIHSSSASAPPVLEDINTNWKYNDMVNEKIIKSNRSTAASTCTILNCEENSTDLVSLHPDINIHNVFNDSITLANSEEFENSWLDSKRKALEDIEDGSVDDVFQVGTSENEDSRKESESTKNRWLTPVSEWMKLIHVVNSSSESQSSVETISVDPRSFHARESFSTDLSLEGSLAKSMVDAEKY